MIQANLENVQLMKNEKLKEETRPSVISGAHPSVHPPVYGISNELKQSVAKQNVSGRKPVVYILL